MISTIWRVPRLCLLSSSRAWGTASWKLVPPPHSIHQRSNSVFGMSVRTEYENRIRSAHPSRLTNDSDRPSVNDFGGLFQD